MSSNIEHFCEIEEKLAFNLKDFFRLTLQKIKINIVSRALITLIIIFKINI